jgi:hypothetical protein
VKRVLASVVLLLTLAACGGGGGDSDAADTTLSPLLKDVKTYTDLSRTHVKERVTYAQNPPVGGDHNPVWQNCGFYDQPVYDETAVHSMEHGAVWITYDPDLPADQVAILKNLVNGHSKVLVSPREDLPTPVVANAWGKQLTLPTFDEATLRAFIAAFEEGPQTPEPSASCSGGYDKTADTTATTTGG